MRTMGRQILWTLALGLLCVGIAGAQAPDNGLGGRLGGCLNSPNLAADGSWYCFAWDSNPSGPVVVANPVFATGPNRIDVTDCGCAGDAFQVRVDGQVIGTTPSVPADPTCERGFETFDECFTDPAFSHATFQLGPGQHTVQIEVIDNPFNSGNGAIRAHRVIQAIPTLSQIGLAVFLLALLGASLFILRRRRAV